MGYKVSVICSCMHHYNFGVSLKLGLVQKAKEPLSSMMLANSSAPWCLAFHLWIRK